ncbi:MAG: outer membrane protein assembly factor BamA [Ectothiorhodospiraceae bacterium]
MRTLAAAVVLVLGLLSPAQAFDAFTAEDIRLEGLRRISPGTVFTHLPVSTGDRVDEALAAEAVRELFDTGFFNDVELRRDGDTLVVALVERPAVAEIEIRGNDAIESEPLLQAMRDSGLAEGETFNRALLDGIQRQLRRQYFSQGHYNVDVETTVSPLERNRVAVRIDVDEGQAARIEDIHFTGNDAFSDDTLQDIVSLGPRPWYLPFSGRDQYSREALQGDLESVRSHYLNRGYADFSLVSNQVSLSPDRSRIFVTVNVDEGAQYRIGDVDIVGDTIVGRDELAELVEIEEGELFSRENIEAGASAIRERLGEEGYAFANVNPAPDIDREDESVDLTYFVDPGDRTYVRRVNITGNNRTDDEVIRRDIRQMEGGLLLSGNIEQSRRNLNQLGFFERVEFETPRVPGEPNQVDVNVDVTEGLSGNIQAGIGLSSDQGLLLNFSTSQDNILGSGDRVRVAANNSRVSTLYQFSYTDRYYNIDGVTRHFDASLRDFDARRDNRSDFSLREGEVDVGFTVPLNEDDSVRFDAGIEDLKLELGDDPADRQVRFRDREGESFFNYLLGVSWSRNTLNRRVFPTSGSQQSLSGTVTLPGSDLEYFKANYRYTQFLPLGERTALSFEGRAGYGEGYADTGRLPFFKNFFAGGPRSVRGYQSSTLGRRGSDGEPAGGNVRTIVTTELFFPPPLVDVESVRLSTFVDGGQVYDTREQSVDASELRYSAGMGLTWMSPLGALTVSLAEPFNTDANSETERFQFTIGQFF